MSPYAALCVAWGDDGALWQHACPPQVPPAAGTSVRALACALLFALILCIYVHAHAHICTCVHTRMHKPTRARTRASTHHTHTHTHTHTHIHTHTHTHDARAFAQDFQGKPKRIETIFESMFESMQEVRECIRACVCDTLACVRQCMYAPTCAVEWLLSIHWTCMGMNGHGREFVAYTSPVLHLFSPTSPLRILSLVCCCECSCVCARTHAPHSIRELTSIHS